MSSSNQATGTTSSNSWAVGGRPNIYLVFASMFVLLLCGLLWSVTYGVTESITLQTVFEALVGENTTNDHSIVREIRLPRALIGALAGASLAIAGVLIQGITRNPLASPSIFGVTAGASFMVVASLAVLPVFGAVPIVIAAILGGAIGGFIVLMAGGIWQREIDQIRLPLAGIAVTALLVSLTQGVVLFSENSTESVLYWLAGAIDGSTWRDAWIVGPFLVIGLGSSLALARPLDILALSEDVAVSLGQPVTQTRVLAASVLIALTGAAVAVAGPIAFIGLIVPHIARRLVGQQHLPVILLSTVMGAVLLVYADIVARMIAYPYETPAGIITALIGGPFFLYLARHKEAQG